MICLFAMETICSVRGRNTNLPLKLQVPISKTEREKVCTLERHLSYKQSPLQQNLLVPEQLSLSVYRRVPRAAGLINGGVVHGNFSNP